MLDEMIEKNQIRPAPGLTALNFFRELQEFPRVPYARFSKQRGDFYTLVATRCSVPSGQGRNAETSAAHSQIPLLCPRPEGSEDLSE